MDFSEALLRHLFDLAGPALAGLRDFVNRVEYFAQLAFEDYRQFASGLDASKLGRLTVILERKLGEVLNRHGGRRARYRGTEKVFIQELMACIATNIKRIAKLVCAPNVAAAAT